MSAGPVAAASGMKDCLEYFATARAFERAATGALPTDAFRQRALRGGSKCFRKPGHVGKRSLIRHDKTLSHLRQSFVMSSHRLESSVWHTGWLDQARDQDRPASGLLTVNNFRQLPVDFPDPSEMMTLYGTQNQIGFRNQGPLAARLAYDGCR